MKKQQEKKFNFVELKETNFIISETVFNEMFPNRHKIYTYEGFIQAVSAFYESLVGVNEKQTLTNILAFLANASHETTGDGFGSGTYDKGLYFINEGGDSILKLSVTNPWCKAYGITPNGTQAYYGRGCLQLSYKYNYKAACEGIPNIPADIYNNPKSVIENPYLAWTTGLWFWCTSQGNKPSCSDVIRGKWQPSNNDKEKGRIAETFANKMGVVTNIINGGIEAGSWDYTNRKVVSQSGGTHNNQAINRQKYYQYFVNSFFSDKDIETMTNEEYNTNQAANMANFNF